MQFGSDFQTLYTFHGLTSLVVLTLLELILGVDNIIFISILLTKIPDEKRFRTRTVALSLAFLMRAIMLFGLVWLSRITTLFAIHSFQISIRDLLFLIGGGYLVFNTVKELLHHQSPSRNNANKQVLYKSIILQIVVVDMLFSFDSIFTAIGLISNLLIMMLAIGLGMICMIYISGKTSAFIEKNLGVKTLALCFIIAVGLMLLTEAFHIEVPITYLYALFGAAFVIERIASTIKK
jgi:predicted tellurium resistance membrane protein TerC